MFVPPGEMHGTVAGPRGMVVVACQGDAERLVEHQERAEAYLEEEKYAEAAIEFKSMLQVDPNHADAER